MARTTATNFSGGLQFPYATAATDLFKKEDVQTLAQAVDQHDHSSGKGLPLNVGTAIPVGSITSAMIADGTITSADILDGTIVSGDMAVGAASVSRYVASSTANPTTTSAALADIPDLTIGPVTVGGPSAVPVDLLCWLECSLTSSVVANVTLAIWINGSDLSPMQFTVSPGTYVLGTAFTLLGALAGAPSLTFKGRWSTTGGTLTAVSTYRNLLVHEHRR